jgi:hypothetical protein
MKRSARTKVMPPLSGAEHPDARSDAAPHAEQAASEVDFRQSRRELRASPPGTRLALRHLRGSKMTADDERNRRDGAQAAEYTGRD